MVTKTKINNIESKLGILAMTLLTTISSMDINTNHIRSQVAITAKPVLVFQEESNDINSMRRERDETAPHYISYSETQRTPSRSSKH